MSKKYDLIVYIGRFQIPHKEHIATIKHAQTLATDVLVLVGSSYKPCTYKNPFSYNKRIAMLEAETTDVSFIPIIDYLYDDIAWAAQVQKLVTNHAGGPKIGIIGYKKDESSFYLDMFPQWDFIEFLGKTDISASTLRASYFSETGLSWLLKEGIKHINVSTVYALEQFASTNAFKEIVAERKFVEEYKKGFAMLPYPPTFVTSDAVVVQSGNILLIKRKNYPGKGLWALPGGFVNANTDKSVEAAMLRELDEETGLKVPVKVLKGSIKEVKVFDAIERSARGRTITHAFSIVLEDGHDLPKVTAGDDAALACWVPISAVLPELMFEDHFDIISYFHKI